MGTNKKAIVYTQHCELFTHKPPWLPKEIQENTILGSDLATAIVKAQTKYPAHTIEARVICDHELGFIENLEIVAWREKTQRELTEAETRQRQKEIYALDSALEIAKRKVEQLKQRKAELLR